MPAPQQAKKILEKKFFLAFSDVYPSNVLVSQAAQQCRHPAPKIPSSGTAVSLPPCSGTQPLWYRNLTLNSLKKKKGGFSHSVLLESGTRNCAKRCYTELLPNFCFLCSVRSWLFSWGGFSAEVRPFSPSCGRWRSPRAGCSPIHPQQPQQVLSLCRRLWQMSAGLSPRAGLAGVTDTSVLLLSLAQCLGKERKAGVMPL